jgi:hypothetical protein
MNGGLVHIMAHFDTSASANSAFVSLRSDRCGLKEWIEWTMTKNSSSFLEMAKACLFRLSLVYADADSL